MTVKNILATGPARPTSAKKKQWQKIANSAAGIEKWRGHAPKKARRGIGRKTADPSSPFAVLKQLNKGAKNADEA